MEVPVRWSPSIGRIRKRYRKQSISLGMPCAFSSFAVSGLSQTLLLSQESGDRCLPDFKTLFVIAKALGGASRSCRSNRHRVLITRCFIGIFTENEQGTAESKDTYNAIGGKPPGDQGYTRVCRRAIDAL